MKGAILAGVAIGALWATSAQADSTTSCRRSITGSTINCNTTDWDSVGRENAAAGAAVGSALGSILFRPKVRQPKAPAFQPPASYDIENGNTFLDVCGGDYRGFRDAMGVGLCAGYVTGYIRRDEELGQNRKICMPKGATFKQLVDTVADFIRASPAVRHYPTAMLADVALSRAFPCAAPVSQPVIQPTPPPGK